MATRPGLHRLRVLYEDPHLLAVDKPAGVHTAPLRQGEEGTLLGSVIASYPEVARVPGIKAVEPGLLHRLDRETSGVVLVARTPGAFAALRAQFEGERVRKEYLAVCVPEPGRGGGAEGPSADTPRAAAPRGHAPLLRIESLFAPDGPGRRRVRVVLPGAGSAGPTARRKASPRLYVTEARVLETGEGRALVGAWLLRGFRHQVRAHLAHLGLPILGDPLYGASCLPGGGLEPRLYLHAAAVELRHPLSGAPLRIDSPVPLEFAAALRRG